MRRPDLQRFCLYAGVIASVSAAAPRPACAQQITDAASAARRELIEHAVVARDAGRHDEALDLATRAGVLEMSASLRRFIAEEQTATARLAEALGSAQRCVVESERDTGPNRSIHLAACRALVSDLRMRVGHVVLNVPDGAPIDLQVRVAGTELPRALWGVSYVVTPGAVPIEFSTPGHATTRLTVNVGRGETSTVALPVPGNSPERRGPVPSHVAARASGVPAGAIVLLVTAVVIGAAGGVSAGLQADAVSRLDQSCGGSYSNCMATDLSRARAQYDTAMGYTIAADVGFALAGVAAVGGVLWWVVGSREHRESPRAASFQPWIANESSGLVVRGAF